MDDPTCSYPCLMKLDLQDSTDKLAFLKDNWPSFGQIESMNLNVLSASLMSSLMSS